MESVTVRYGTLQMWEEEKKGKTYVCYNSSSRNVREQIIKGMSGRQWQGGDKKTWPNNRMFFAAPKSCRNEWHLRYWMDLNPYQQYSSPIVPFGLTPRYHVGKGRMLSPFPHQIAMADHWWTRKQCHIAAEMRTGKTLPALSVAERLNVPTWIIAPRSAIAGIGLEIKNWGFPTFYTMTYEKLKSVLENWGDQKPPQCVIFDEFSKAKEWTTGNTQACFHLTEAMRREHKDPWIMGMTGTPAPNSPLDWWSQIEIIQPGFLLENHPAQFRDRLAIVEKRESNTGGFFPHIVTWLDDENKCKYCGQEDHFPEGHPYTKSVNEIAALAKRLEGMTKVFFKKDCMNLPDKEFIRMRLPVDKMAETYARLVVKSAVNGAIALNRLRQISAGFMYGGEATTEELPCHKCDSTGVQNRNTGIGQAKQLVDCPDCKGEGFIFGSTRKTNKIACPKDQAFKDLLEECEEKGRMVSYGSFNGSIDRMVEIGVANGWQVIRVDGRGWVYFGVSFGRDSDALAAFASGRGKILFVGHPKSGGMGISLSAADTIVYWDNSFAADDRLQSVERGTDAGMDMNKGCRIIDLVHLPVDELVLDKLEKKENLQAITMGEIRVRVS